MEYLKELLFGFEYQAVDQINLGLHTVNPDNQPSEQEWMKEFSVSMLYDRKIVHID